MRLVLDYIKVLVWPLVVIVVLGIFRDDLRELMKRVQSFQAAGVAATLGTNRPENAANPNVPDVFFGLVDITSSSNCTERATIALKGSGFSNVQQGEVTYGYTDKYVGAVWCRSQNPILITVAGPKDGLGPKHSELEKLFKGQMP